MAAVSAAALRSEVETRNRFVFSHLRRKASRAELKDLVDFMHDGEARILTCPTCGVLVRDERQTRASGSYEADPNDPDLMEHVYPRYVEAFRRKAPGYKDRLGSGASVVEVGSHLGGFLQAAEEWNWRPVGLDVGRDTAEFARRRGLSVRREMIEDSHLPAGSADAVFIWNCFEQLADPEPALMAARQLLKRFGELVLRVPNAAAWLRLRRDDPHELAAWNNLLGFPYLYGYTVESLSRLVRRFGFEPVRSFHSELLTLPFPDSPEWLVREQAKASARAAEWSADSREAPWIELVCRVASEPLRSAPKLDGRFLPRAM